MAAVEENVSGQKGKIKKRAHVPRVVKKRAKKYSRGQKSNLEGVADKKLKDKLLRLEGKYEEAALRAARSEVLLTEDVGYVIKRDPFFEGNSESTYGLCIWYLVHWKLKGWKEHTNLPKRRFQRILK